MQPLYVTPGVIRKICEALDLNLIRFRTIAGTSERGRIAIWIRYQWFYDYSALRSLVTTTIHTELNCHIFVAEGVTDLIKGIRCMRFDMSIGIDEPKAATEGEDLSWLAGPEPPDTDNRPGGLENN